MANKALVAATFSLASASMQDIEKSLRMMGKKTTLTRSFAGPWASQIVSNINGYGCWCYFQDNHGKGRGSPKNEVDSLCKTLQDGYSCIMMDAMAMNETCTPWEVPYQAGSGLGLAADEPENDSLEYAVRSSCESANSGDNCATRACMVESYFVMKMFGIFLGGVDFDPNLKHDLGGFDRIQECPMLGVGVEAEKECCGVYPLRYPFKVETSNGNKGCCGDKTYLSDLMMCCPGDQIEFVGTC